jgi:tetratricopeptide (TPR) repeat protein/transglutaminase-like putative cysteine protease
MELIPSLLDIEQYTTADSLLKALLAEYPNSADLHYYLGLTSDRAGNPQLAQSHFATALSMDPYDQDYVRAAMSLTQEGIPLRMFSAAIDSSGLVTYTPDSVIAMSRACTTSTAPYGAVVLLDRRQSIVKNRWRGLTRVHRIIKLLSEEALEYFGQVTWSFDSWYESPRLIMARVIRPDGGVIEVKPDDVFVTGAEDSNSDDARVVTWNFPQISPGSITEFILQFDRGYVEPERLFYSYLVDEWNPLVRYEKEMIVPATWPIREVHTPGVTYTVTDSSGLSVNRWSAENLEPMVWESNSPTYWEQGERIFVGYRQTWAELVDWYWGKIYSKVDTGGPVSEKARALTEGLDSERDKIAALFDYVAKDIRYTAISFGEGSIVPFHTTEIMESGYGDCKDKTTLLISLLGAVGIEAYPVLTNEYDSATFCDSVPTTSQFSHMVTYIPSLESRFVDPTCDKCLLSEYAVAYKGQPALIVDTSLAEPLVRTPPVTPDDYTYNRKVRILPREGGGVDLTVDIEFGAQGARNLKYQYEHADSADIAELVRSHSNIGLWARAKVDDYELDDSIWLTGEKFGWTASMSADSLFMKEQDLASANVWFYSVGEYLTVPDTIDRKLDCDAGILYSVRDQFTVVPGPKWELNSYLVPWDMDTTWFKATSKVTEWEDSVRIQAEYVQKMSRIPAEDVIPFVKAVNLAYRRLHNQSPVYRKAVDPQRLANMETAIAENPEDVSLLVNYAQLLLGEDRGGARCEAEERRREAREVLRKALEIDPTNETILTWLAGLLMIDELNQEADSLLRAFSAEHSLSMLGQSLLATNAWALGDLSDAAEGMNKLMTQLPGDELRLNLASIYIDMERYEDALKQVKLLETLGADSGLVAAGWFNYYLALDSLDEARQLIENWPDTSTLRLLSLKTQLYSQTEEYDKAVANAYELLVKYPDNSTFLNNTAWFLGLLDSNLTGALEMVNRALALQGPCDLGYLNTRGLVLLKMGRIEEAREDFLTCCRSQAAQSQTLNRYFLGECALAEDDESSAIDYYKQAMEYDGDRVYVAKCRERLSELGVAID